MSAKCSSAVGAQWHYIHV